jgi:hypothetical protein
LGDEEYQAVSEETAMIRTACLSLAALVLLLSSESHSQQGVAIFSTIEDTPALPGFKTATVYAITTHPVAVVDFRGDGNKDPAIGKGFFGPLHQFSEAIPSVFSQWQPYLPPHDPRHDSHFLASRGGTGEEGPTFLQGYVSFGHDRSLLTVPFAQLVIPNGQTVTYRGSIRLLVGPAGFPTFDVSGVIVAVPEPATVPIAFVAVASLFALRRRG